MSERVRLKPAKRRMTEFTIDEVSAVDKPAQEPALAAITKNDGDGAFTKEDHEFVGSIVKRYIDPAEGAKPFSEVIDERMKSQKYHEAMEVAGPVIYALECSLSSIAGDANLTSATKETMMRQAVEEFLSVMRSKWPRVEAALMKALADDGGDETLEKGDDEMVKKTDDKNVTGVEALKAQLAEVQKQLDALTKDEGDGKGKAAKKAEGDTAEAIAALTKTFEELTEKVNKVSEEHDDLVAKAKMSDEEKEYMDKLKTDADKAKFKAMSSDERKKAMAKTKKADDTADEIIKTEDGEVRKSEVGPALFSILKAQTARAETLEKALEDERNLRKFAQYEKRAKDELGHLPGEVTAKADVLKAIDELKDEDVKKAALEMLKAGDGAMTAAFSTIGHRKNLTKDGSATAGSGFTKRVSEIAKRDECTRTEAMSKARKEYPDEYKEYQESVGH